MASTPVTGYTFAQRAVHWLMALLIFFNLLFSDGMEHWNRLVRHGETVTANDIASANIHAYVGIAILLLFFVRLAMRLSYGAPDAPEEEPPLIQLGAKIAHYTLYLLFLIMPLSGIAKYYFGLSLPGELHGGIFKVALWALIVAHILGAMVHQFYWKTNVLARMTTGVKS
ncbi:cytochrome b/b6 domain-containing protein [Allorhizobium sp. BGMRC 0089]|uniref:cytochrome b n=1 Tax=Allorhizobium sonneratiae TaxID=2934936 RepID=UPI00203407C7|nr:cytochrome b/b6 domain-containing protein [Allorhizobium sonneratiae]MCM2293405.1 cytochrome b/b6 domain-containing protein [Allorhizobium sonneratiae]